MIFPMGKILGNSCGIPIDKSSANSHIIQIQPSCGSIYGVRLRIRSLTLEDVDMDFQVSIIKKSHISHLFVYLSNSYPTHSGPHISISGLFASSYKFEEFDYNSPDDFKESNFSYSDDLFQLCPELT